MGQLQKLVRSGKRAAVSLLAWPLVRDDFPRTAAREWVRELYRDWRAPAVSRLALPRVHRSGFTSRTHRFVEQDPARGAVISQRDYHALRPLNPASPWLSNRIVAARAIPRLSAHLPAALAVISPVDRTHADWQVEWAVEHAEAATLEDLVRAAGELTALPVSWRAGKPHVISADGDAFRLDGDPIAAGELSPALMERTGRARYLLTRWLPGADPVAEVFDAAESRLRLRLGRDDDGSARVLDAELLLADADRVADDPADGIRTRRDSQRWTRRLPIDRARGAVADSGDGIPGFAAVVAELESLLSHPRAPFRFIAVDLLLQPDGAFVITDVDARPGYPQLRLLDPAANAYLLALSAAAVQRRADRAARAAEAEAAPLGRGRLIRRARAFRLRSEGFTGRAARSWVRLMEQDRRAGSGVPEKERERAYAWGFTPAVVADFGITEANRHDFISMREYLYAQPLNGKYQKWISDRVSALMVFKPFQAHLDLVDFQVLHRDGALHIIPISTAAHQAGEGMAGLAAHLAEHGPLALAASTWSSPTRAILAHDGASLTIDGTPCSIGEATEILTSFVRNGSHVLMPPHADTVSGETDAAAPRPRVEVTMMNPGGANPTVAEAFVRFDTAPDIEGESRRSYTCRIDPETGSYSGARTRIDGRVQAFRHDPVTGVEFAGTVVEWASIVDLLTRMCAFAPQLRFVRFTLETGGDRPRITAIVGSPAYNREFPFSPHTVAFLRECVEEKRAHAAQRRARVQKGLHNARLKVRREFAAAFYPKGLLPYQSVRWPSDVARDLFQRNGVPLKTKLWAYRHGYLSYRIPQYGITPENRHRFISDFEYRWLRHINDRYKYWLEDKVSIKYVAADYNELLPAYYFYTTRSNGRNHVVPMMDCPEGYGSDYDDVLRLAREKGRLALKPDEGSHGEGFFRLGWEDGTYSLNGVPATEDDVVRLLADPGNRYLITEFIDMHSTLADIYPDSVNTIRMIVFKRDGRAARLGNAYLRIGTSASGHVDNTAAGGMLAQIDIESGRFGNAQALVDGRVQACPRHPDTGVLIEGEIPHWEYVKTQILRMAESFSQLEYLGFDVAITPDGFKIPEINRFPDFPRIDLLTPETMDYLFLKLAQKKRRYGYDRRPPRTLITLPRRDT